MTAPIKSSNKEIRRLIKRWLVNNLETTTIAKVINVSEYSSSRVVDVLPLPMERMLDGQVRVPSPIYRCPVSLEGNLDGYISYPMKVGDKVAIGYCKQSIAEFIYSQKAAQYIPEDLSLFGANDAVVLGFVGQSNVDKAVSPTNFELNYKNSNLAITPSDDITLSNPDGYVNIDPSGTITISNDAVTITASNSGAVTVTTSGVFSVTASSISLNGAIVDGIGNVTTALNSDLDDIYTIYNTHTHTENDNVGTSQTNTPTQQLP